MKNLEKYLNYLNIKWDGVFNFKYSVKLLSDNKSKEIIIYDENEEYNIDFEDVWSLENEDIINEFSSYGIIVKNLKDEQRENIFKKIEEAVKKDIKNKDAYLDWEDSVRLCIYDHR